MELVNCAICGGEHDIEAMQIAYARCDAELAIPEEDREKRCWGNQTDFLQIDTDRWFIRGWLPVPVIGRDAPFAWGVWVAVSHDDFWHYLRTYSEDARHSAPFPGRIANQIAVFDSTLDLEVSVQLRGAADRPLLTVVDENHPLGQEQRSGIGLERLMACLHGA